MMDVQEYWNRQTVRLRDITRFRPLSRVDQLVHEVHFNLDPDYRERVMKSLEMVRVANG